MKKFQMTADSHRFTPRVRHYHRQGAKTHRFDTLWADGHVEYDQMLTHGDLPTPVASHPWLHVIAILVAVLGLVSIITEMAITFQTKPMISSATGANLANP